MGEWYETKEGVLDALEKNPRVVWDKNIAQKALNLWCEDWAVNVISKEDTPYGNLAWSDDENDGAVASHEIAINIARAVGVKPVSDTDNTDQAEHFAALTLENIKNIRNKLKD